MKDVYVVIEKSQARSVPDVYVYENEQAARSRFDAIVKDLVGLGYENTYRYDLPDDFVSVDYEMEGVSDSCVSVMIMAEEIIKGSNR